MGKGVERCVVCLWLCMYIYARRNPAGFPR